MHQLAKAVIVFDEIQALPIKCAHLFCNAIHFLLEYCGSSAVLCTATQPLLNEINGEKGAIQLTLDQEIVPNVKNIFNELKRVEIIDNTQKEGWRDEEIAQLAIESLKLYGSCLVVVNTKKSAYSLYDLCKKKTSYPVYHLSTHMCAAHRRKFLADIEKKLHDNEPVLCISTQLIEAGVDVDFGAAIRFLAGLDSIAQTAGRCNRNNRYSYRPVYIVNALEENITEIVDIKIGQEKTERILEEFKKRPDLFDGDLLSPAAMSLYFKYFFFDRADIMDYPVKTNEIGREDTLLRLLTSNDLSAGEYARRYADEAQNNNLILKQSFASASRAFRAIDAPTQGIIVQYEQEGKNMVAELCSAYEVNKQYKLLHSAQHYSVNVFPHVYKKLQEQGAIFEVQKGADIWYLDERYYSDEFGLSTEIIGKFGMCHI